jgi:hypothetical protein
LSTAPFSAGVQVQHAQGGGLSHPGRMECASGARNAGATAHPIELT